MRLNEFSAFFCHDQYMELALDKHHMDEPLGNRKVEVLTAMQKQLLDQFFNMGPTMITDLKVGVC